MANYTQIFGKKLDIAINVGAFGDKVCVKGKDIGDAAAGEWTSNSAICSKGTWLAIRAAN
jgi:hypothetical protein